MFLQLLVIVYINFCIYLVPINAELKRFDHPAKGDGTLSFLVIGDWGRRGWYNQSQVANQVLINYKSLFSLNSSPFCLFIFLSLLYFLNFCRYLVPIIFGFFFKEYGLLYLLLLSFICRPVCYKFIVNDSCALII